MDWDRSRTAKGGSEEKKMNRALALNVGARARLLVWESTHRKMLMWRPRLKSASSEALFSCGGGQGCACGG